MKISYAVSFQETNFNFIAHGSWLKKAETLSSLGYEGIELSIKDPEKKGIVKDIERALKKHNLALAAVGTGQMFVDEGLSLSSLKSDIRVKAIERLKKHIDFARNFNTQVILGLARGGKIVPGEPISLYKKNLKESFQQVSDYAYKREVTVAIEAINRYETNFLNSASEVMEFIGSFKNKYLRILLDTFHMNIEEKNFSDSIMKVKSRLSHVHLADSNRMYAGMGHLDFCEIASALKKARYGGYLSAEVLSFPDFKTSASRYIKNIRRIL